LNEAGKTVRGSKIAILGVAYKPGIKDIQLTPVESVITRLRDMGAMVKIFDPMYKGDNVFGLRVDETLEDAIRGADCIVVGTAHSEFRNLDLAELSRMMKRKAAFVDARNVVQPALVVKAGFAYRGVGRKP
ncbi:MAG: UDP-glucose/GDP-mannose dehydrogenase family protein, partial [Thaumarchaeota archaeon]|nr:UDP-glucose/GDP-mannose dehydrogenase family protein [Nitrososphaerota archaeon]